MPRRLLTTLLFLALPAAPLVAQGLELPPPPKPIEPAQGDGSKDPQAQGEKPATEDDTTRAAAPTAEGQPTIWDDPQNPAEEIFLAFERAGRDTEVVHKRTVDELRKLGLGTRPTALKALTSTFSPSVVIGAELLEWVGDPEDADALVAAASVTPDTAAVNACLSCAMRLGNGQLPPSAVKLLDHPRRQVRTLAEARLGERTSERYLPKLLQFLNYGRDTDLKLRAARLLAAYPLDEEVRRGLRQTLAEDSVEIAFVAVHALQGEGDEASIHWLANELLTAKTSQEAGYLAYALAELQDRRAELILNPGLEARLRFLLDDQDLFVSGAAASLLAELAFRTDLVGSQEELDRKLPLYLVRAVGGVLFYPQYATFAPLAERSLRRITGEDFSDQDGSAWIRWLQKNQEGFHLVRGRLPLTEEALPRLRLAWQAGGKPAVVFVGPEATWNYGDRILGASALTRLHQALQASGLLEADVLPGRYGLDSDPLRISFDLSFDGRRKMVRFHGQAGASRTAALAQTLAALKEDSTWQTLASRDEAGRQFILSHLDEFDGLPAGTARQAALLALMRERLQLLDSAALHDWVAELQQMPDLASLWSDDLAQDFLALLPREAEKDPLFASALLDLALTVPDAALLTPTVDSILSLPEALQPELLKEGLRPFAVEDLSRLLGDPRLAVRVAAVTALANGPAEAAQPLLQSALGDPELAVQQAALRSLGTLAVADDATLEILMQAAEPSQPAVLRGEALWGLGRLGRAEAIPLLAAAAVETEVPIQVAALTALGRLGLPESDRALGQLFPSFAGGDLESSYLRAVMGRGAGHARRMLRPQLLAEDPFVADRAALLLGGLGDPTAAPSLMAMLPSAPRDAELLEALAATLCVDFRRLPDPAGTYRAWWEEHHQEPPSLWLQKPAAEAGFPLAPAFMDPGQVAPRVSGKVLLDLLLNGPAWLRPAAAYYLENLSGRDSEVILGKTPAAEVRRRAEPWQAWLAS